MTATELIARQVAKPWGRRALPAGFADAGSDDVPIGEIWFVPPHDTSPLMVKFLFTSERLSIQVHPDDAAARRLGLARGKDEAWIILAVEPGATIALGPKLPTTRAALAAAARDGSIEELLDWRPVAAGDVIYVVAGTIHALGAGLTLVEVQQNVDVTYRLYDYGRGRELHLDAGLAVADLQPFRPQFGRSGAESRQLLVAGKAFSVERLGGGSYDITDAAGGVFLSVSGSGRMDGKPFDAGCCWSLGTHTLVELETGAEGLLAYPPYGNNLDCR